MAWFRAVGRRLRTKRIGLDDVGAGIDIFRVDLTYEVRCGDIHLVVTSVDKDAFV